MKKPTIRSTRSTREIPVERAPATMPDNAALQELLTFMQTEGIDPDAEASAVTSGGDFWPFLSVRGGTFQMGKDTLGTELNALIFASVRERNLYLGKFDAKKRGVMPDCAAVGQPGSKAGLVPAPAFGTYKPKAKTCEVCALGAWDGNTPPKCTQYIRIAGILLDKQQPFVAKIARTSTKGFSNYINGLRRSGLSTSVVITTMRLTEGNDQSPFYWEWNTPGVLPMDELRTLHREMKRAVEEVCRFPIR